MEGCWEGRSGDSSKLHTLQRYVITRLPVHRCGGILAEHRGDGGGGGWPGRGERRK